MPGTLGARPFTSISYMVPYPSSSVQWVFLVSLYLSCTETSLGLGLNLVHSALRGLFIEWALPSKWPAAGWWRDQGAERRLQWGSATQGQVPTYAGQLAMIGGMHQALLSSSSRNVVVILYLVQSCHLLPRLLPYSLVSIRTCQPGFTPWDWGFWVLLHG